MINLQIKCNSKQNDKLCGLTFGWQGNPEVYKIQIKYPVTILGKQSGLIQITFPALAFPDFKLCKAEL